MKSKLISHDDLEVALRLRDLSDPNQGGHAMQELIHSIHSALAREWCCQRLLYRACPIVSVKENYDDLGYPPEGVARDARYTRYISESALLRTQITASIPRLLRALSYDEIGDVLLICPGLVYRRDVIDRLHVGEPHQLDLWRVKSGRLELADLHVMITAVVQAALPNRIHRTVETQHPFTIGGLQIDVEVNGQWVEIGECGIADPKLLSRCGLDPDLVSGLAMGLGLDRLVMLRKGIEDIRLLRSKDSWVVGQMNDLGKYHSVSNQPHIKRDLSVCVADQMDAEQIGDRVRVALGEDLDALESLEIVSETSYDKLPSSARERMGICEGQKNILVRLTIRHPTYTLTAEEANRIRDKVYLKIHEGKVLELTKG